MDAKLERKIANVQKLMEQAATQGEAEAAAAAFSRLLARHNLTEAEAQGFVADQEPGYIHQKIRVAKDGPGVTWRVYLIHTLAYFNFCRVIRTNIGAGGMGRGNNGKGGGVVHLIGQPANVEAVKALFATLAPKVELLSSQAYLKMEHSFYDNNPTFRGISGLLPNRRAWTNSWLRGFPNGLWAKLQEERDQELVDPSMANFGALVLVKDTALTQAVQDLLGWEPSKGYGYRASNGDAYRKGYQEGKNYSDAKQVSATSPRALKG